MMMSAIVLVLSIVAVAVAVLALSRSGTPSPAAAQQGPATAPVPTSPALPASNGAEPDPGGSGADPSDFGTIPTINPAGAYTRAYQDERLRAESGGCGGSWQVGIDLDLPQVKGGNVDIRYSSCNPGAILSGLQQAEVLGPGATPEECLEKIRTQPAGDSIPVAKDLTLCFRTDKNQALAEAKTQKIVFMTITDVSSSTDNGGILTFTLNAWNVP